MHSIKDGLGMRCVFLNMRIFKVKFYNLVKLLEYDAQFFNVFSVIAFASLKLLCDENNNINTYRNCMFYLDNFLFIFYNIFAFLAHFIFFNY